MLTDGLLIPGHQRSLQLQESTGDDHGARRFDINDPLKGTHSVRNYRR